MKPQRLPMTMKLPPFEVAENTAAGVDIGAPVVATDVDSDDTLTYTLGGTDAASFDIESTTTGGQLQTKAALDYETQTDYEVTVIATDDGVPPLTGDNHGHYQTLTMSK